MSSINDDYTIDDDFADDSVVETTPQRPRREQSNLDRLRSTLAKEIKVDACTIDVPLRKGLSLDIEVSNLTVSRMEAYQERATTTKASNRRQRRSGNGEKKVDQMYLASIILHNHCVAIRINDEIVTTDDGANLRLDDPEFLDMLNIVVSEDVVAVMTELFVMELHVINAFMEVQEYLEETTDERSGDENPLAR